MPEKPNFIPIVSLAALKERERAVVRANGNVIVLFLHGGIVHAVDNRCPHMGFPLDRGSIKDGILTCHWHHARFDLCTGGTFDPWADDVRRYPVEIRDGEVFVDVAAQEDARERQRKRLMVGLERDIALVLGKATLVLADTPQNAIEPFRDGLQFGARYRRRGWGQGLTMHTCFMNLLPYLKEEDRPRALYHGLSAVARDTAGSAPRFPMHPLPGASSDMATFKRWFRRFIEVRDDEGAERCIVTAIRAGATPQQVADMLFAAVTDHRYIDIGHPADFTNKAFEALEIAGWGHAEEALTSLVRGYAAASRMEESNSWRNPIDLVQIVQNAFERLAEMSLKMSVDAGHGPSQAELIAYLHGDDPQATIEAMLEALQNGAGVLYLAGIVSYAAALRLARFHTSNEFSDWDTALHTFTFANAVEQGLRRSHSRDLLRGVFDAAMSVFLDRFLNIPAARLPEPGDLQALPQTALQQLPRLLDHQQQVNEAGNLVATYLHAGGEPSELLAILGHLLLREDRDFHTVQAVEAAFRQYQTWRDHEAGIHILIGATRYLAAHCPTVRAQGQTFDIASRLHRGDRIFEGD